MKLYHTQIQLRIFNCLQDGSRQIRRKINRRFGNLQSPPLFPVLIQGIGPTLRRRKVMSELSKLQQNLPQICIEIHSQITLTYGLPGDHNVIHSTNHYILSNNLHLDRWIHPQKVTIQTTQRMSKLLTDNQKPNCAQLTSMIVTHHSDQNAQINR